MGRYVQKGAGVINLSSSSPFSFVVYKKNQQPQNESKDSNKCNYVNHEWNKSINQSLKDGSD